MIFTKKWILTLYSLVLNPILNGMAFFYTDVFYENHTHIGNSLHHPIYFFIWSLSTVFGYYYFSREIWNHYKIKYNKLFHLLIHVIMFSCIFVPYGPTRPEWMNDLHVWMAMSTMILYFAEWLYYGLGTILSTYKETFGYYCVIAFSVFVLFYFGHVTSISEMTFSCLSAIYLWYWWKKIVE